MRSKANKDTILIQNCSNIDIELLLTLLGRLREYIDISCTMETGSTNSDLLQKVNETAPCKSTIFLRQAAKQTAGRGRRGKIWLGAKNKMLSFSLAINLPKDKINGLSLVCAIALVEALSVNLPPSEAKRIKLKWPNDILLDGLKLAGILIETSNLQKYSNNCWVVIGIGINYEQDIELENLLKCKLGMLSALNNFTQDLNLTKVLVNCILSLHKYILLFQERGFSTLLSRWYQYDAFLNKNIYIYDEAKYLAYGLVKGVDCAGHLLLQTFNGLKVFTAGEVSLGKIGSKLS